MEIVLLGEGELRPEFERAGRHHDFAWDVADPEQQERLLRRPRADGAETAICNTTVSGRLARTLKLAGFRVVALVHELPGLIRDYCLESTAREIVEYSDAVVFASDFGRVAFETVGSVLGAKALVRPQGLYKRPRILDDRKGARLALRRELGLPDDTMLILAVGFADLRKGFDLFTDVRQYPDVAESGCRAYPLRPLPGRHQHP